MLWRNRRLDAWILYNIRGEHSTAIFLSLPLLCYQRLRCAGSYTILLPRNFSMLNDYMCTPINRKGTTCSECIEGFGPAVMSPGYSIPCSRCTSDWYVVPVYLFLEFVPVTVFYLRLCRRCICIRLFGIGDHASIKRRLGSLSCITKHFHKLSVPIKKYITS